jgi:2-polyprenyl-3-methyl-5-hydroxy-6-metoxy-1,4-benzoquinol methylase
MQEVWFNDEGSIAPSFWVKQYERWNNQRTLSRLKREGLQGRRLLEIGVGSGSFLRLAQEQGYDVAGCDLSRSICRRVEDLYGMSMHNLPIGKVAGEDLFDIVVMNHVLEHVNDPVGVLREVNRLLTSGGIAHIAVPNVACWEAGLSGWASYEPYHLTYFTPKTLVRTVVASGFDISSISTHDSFSGWFLALVRTILGVNRHAGAVTRAGAVSGSALRRRLPAVEHAYRVAMTSFGVGTLPLRFVQSRLRAGDEAICIAQKRQRSAN